MRLLVPLLVLAGVLCLATGFLQMAFHQGAECTQEFQCGGFANVENALAGVAFFSIAFILWGIAGALSWMKRKFEATP